MSLGMPALDDMLRTNKVRSLNWFINQLINWLLKFK